MNKARSCVFRSCAAFTLVDLLVVLITLVCGFCLLAASPQILDVRARQVKDLAQLSQIHKGQVVFASDQNGVFITPGLIARLPYNGMYVPGKGAENLASNDHAALYSAMVMQNYASVDILISPLETSRNVVADRDFDLEQYRPLSGTYWDPDFKSDLLEESNVSYATLLLLGDRKSAHWRNSNASDFVVMGTRGNGSGSGLAEDRNNASFKHSNTHAMLPPHDRWTGNICFNDGRVAFVDPAGAIAAHSPWGAGESIAADDPYVNDDLAKGSDSFLCVVKGGSMGQLEDDLAGYLATWD